MKDLTVRLSGVTLKNIKNVRQGTIEMPLADCKENEICKAEILGIYGQNGSGKTAIVDALFFIQHIMIGRELDQSIIDYIDIDSDSAEINTEFRIYMDNILYEVGYHVCLGKSNSEVWIEREYLNCAVNRNGSRTNKNIFMDYSKSDTGIIFKPQKRLDELTGKNKEMIMNLLVVRKQKLNLWIIQL